MPIATGTSETPDFEVTVRGARIIAEIKELTPNAHDREQARESAAGRAAGGFFDGRRLRDAVSKAAGQLKTFRDEGLPSIVVFYDNIVVNGVRPYPRCPYFDPTQIEWAMYGQHVADYHVPLHGDPIPLGDRRGGKRVLTERNRLYVSAVAILSEFGEYAWFFHNYFAAVPLSRAVFHDDRDRHFHNPSNPLQSLAGWDELAIRG